MIIDLVNHLACAHTHSLNSIILRELQDEYLTSAQRCTLCCSTCSSRSSFNKEGLCEHVPYLVHIGETLLDTRLVDIFGLLCNVPNVIKIQYA